MASISTPFKEYQHAIRADNIYSLVLYSYSSTLIAPLLYFPTFLQLQLSILKYFETSLIDFVLIHKYNFYVLFTI